MDYNPSPGAGYSLFELVELPMLWRVGRLVVYMHIAAVYVGQRLQLVLKHLRNVVGHSKGCLRRKLPPKMSFFAGATQDASLRQCRLRSHS